VTEFPNGTRYLAALPFVRRPLGLTGGSGAPDPEALRTVAREVVMVRINLVDDTTPQGRDVLSGAAPARAVSSSFPPRETRRSARGHHHA
jgi:hypothetical protein